MADSAGSRLADKMAGELTNTGYQAATTTSHYVAPATTYVTGYAGSNTNATYSTAVVGATTTQEIAGRTVGTTVNTGKDVIKGESRIEYVPFEKKVIEYKDQSKLERVPKTVKKVEYREERKIEQIPK